MATAINWASQMLLPSILHLCVAAFCHGICRWHCHFWQTAAIPGVAADVTTTADISHPAG